MRTDIFDKTYKQPFSEFFLPTSEGPVSLMFSIVSGNLMMRSTCPVDCAIPKTVLESDINPTKEFEKDIFGCVNY